MYTQCGDYIIFQNAVQRAYRNHHRSAPIMAINHMIQSQPTVCWIVGPAGTGEAMTLNGVPAGPAGISEVTYEVQLSGSFSTASTDRRL